MCGIAGAYGAGNPEEMREVVSAIVNDQVSRGPDHQEVQSYGTWARGAVLGHDRLSILELSPAGHQPMASADRRYRVVFNGEIYNYLELRAELAGEGVSFHTGSDTEVLLAAFHRWGSDSLQRLNGMFAFGLYDVEKHRLWLVRDRFGVKPLYYTVSGTRMIFASTGREIARQLGLAPNLAYVARGLRYLTYDDDGDVTPYQRLSALQPGHVLTVDHAAEGGMTLDVRRYYDLEGRVASLREELAGEPTHWLAERFDRVLTEAVTLRLRADVAVGVSVSGGLDSGSIAVLAAEEHPRVAGFCYGRPDARDSEGPLVSELARQLGLDVHYCWLQTRQEVSDAFWATLDAQDAPFPTGSIVAQHEVFRAARAAGFKVLLGGQGGDEGLMGYNKFRLLQLRKLLHAGTYWQFAGAAAALLPAILASWAQLPALWRHRRRYEPEHKGYTRLRLPVPPAVSLAGDIDQPLWRRQVLDVTRFSLPTLLRYEDRNSMGNSVESRLPFLDYRLMELGLALPDSEKLRGGWGKWILRSTMRGRLPDSIRLNRAKRGFDANDGCWIRAGLGQEIREGLRDARGSLSDLLPSAGSIDAVFSDAHLSRGGFGEAVALLWLGRKT